MPKYDLVIFDFDGTIADSISIIVDSFQESLKTVTQEVFNEKDIKNLIGLPLSLMIETVLNTNDERIIKNLILEYTKNYDEKIETNLKVYDGILDILNKLKVQNCKLSIATGKTQSGILLSLEKLQIRDLFDLILGSDSVEKPKPDGQMVTKTLQDLGIEADRAIMVGDSHVDIQTGKNGGVKTLGVSWGISTFDQLLAEEPDFIAENLKDLEDILI